MNQLDSEKKHKLGIVLSGGGARGFAHIGVLKALSQYLTLRKYHVSMYRAANRI